MREANKFWAECKLELSKRIQEYNARQLRGGSSSNSMEEQVNKYTFYFILTYLIKHTNKQRN